MPKIGQMGGFKKFFDDLLKKKTWAPSNTVLKKFSPRKFTKIARYARCGERLSIIYSEKGSITLEDYSQWQAVDDDTIFWSGSVAVASKAEWIVNLYMMENLSTGDSARWMLIGFWE